MYSGSFIASLLQCAILLLSSAFLSGCLMQTKVPLISSGEYFPYEGESHCRISFDKDVDSFSLKIAHQAGQSGSIVYRITATDLPGEKHSGFVDIIESFSKVDVLVKKIGEDRYIATLNQDAVIIIPDKGHGAFDIDLSLYLEKAMSSVRGSVTVKELKDQFGTTVTIDGNSEDILAFFGRLDNDNILAFAGCTWKGPSGHSFEPGDVVYLDPGAGKSPEKVKIVRFEFEKAKVIRADGSADWVLIAALHPKSELGNSADRQSDAGERASGQNSSAASMVMTGTAADPVASAASDGGLERKSGLARVKAELHARMERALTSLTVTAAEFKKAGFVLGEVHVEMDATPSVTAYVTDTGSTGQEGAALLELEKSKRSQQILDKLIAARELNFGGYAIKKYAVEIGLAGFVGTKVTAILTQR